MRVRASQSSRRGEEPGDADRKATEEISTQIDAVQANTNQAVKAIREIGNLIEKMTEKMVAVSSAVEEQGASASEIARSTSEAAQSTAKVSTTMQGMMNVAGEAGTNADLVLSAAKGVAEQADTRPRSQNLPAEGQNGQLASDNRPICMSPLHIGLGENPSSPMWLLSHAGERGRRPSSRSFCESPRISRLVVTQS